jgi:hypothetical protein
LPLTERSIVVGRDMTCRGTMLTHRHVARSDPRIHPSRRTACHFGFVGAGYGDGLEGVPEKSVGEIVRILPVDETPCPVDCALRRGVEACWPDGDLDLRRSGRVLTDEV